MDFPFTQPPSWAYDYCYFFYFLAVIQVVLSIFAIVMMKKKEVPVIVAVLLGVAVQSLTSLMLFWMCRGSLKDKRVVVTVK